MILDLGSFLEGSKDIVQFQGEVEFGGLDFNNKNVKIIEPIEYKGEIFKVNGEKVINLNIKYTYSEQCNRCLSPSTQTIETGLYGKLLEGKRDFKNEEEGYEEILYYQNGSLKLDEYILEQVAVSLPIKILCKDDCKGLCPKCGVDLNKKDCNCIHEDIDPRLEKLKNFFPKD